MLILPAPTSEVILQQVLREFKESFDAYIAAWNHGWKTGDATSILDFYSKDFLGSWSRGQETESLSYETEAKSLPESLAQLPGARLLTENVLFRSPKDDEVVIFYDKHVSRAGRESTAFVIETWHRRVDRWKLVRGHVEMTSGSGSQPS